MFEIICVFTAFIRFCFRNLQLLTSKVKKNKPCTSLLLLFALHSLFLCVGCVAALTQLHYGSEG